jgi:O-antigen ligase
MILVFFSIFNYLLFSRAGIISFLIIVIIYFIYSITKSRTAVIKVVKSVFLIGFITIGVLYIALNGRMQTAFKEAGKFKLDKSFIKGNNDDRIPIWYVTGLIIEDNLLAGVGTGDVKDQLQIKYKEYELTEAYRLELNVHNQFLETFLGMGLAGFILILMMFFIPIVAGIMKRNLLLITFFVVFAILMMVESVFNGQAGVVFFVFFYCLIITNLKTRVTYTT